MLRIMCDGSFCAFALRLKSAALSHAASHYTHSTQCCVSSEREPGIMGDANQCLEKKSALLDIAKSPTQCNTAFTTKRKSSQKPVFLPKNHNKWLVSKNFISFQKQFWIPIFSHSRIYRGGCPCRRWYGLTQSCMYCIHTNFCGWHNFRTLRSIHLTWHNPDTTATHGLTHRW